MTRGQEKKFDESLLIHLFIFCQSLQCPTRSSISCAQYVPQSQLLLICYDMICAWYCSLPTPTRLLTLRLSHYRISDGSAGCSNNRSINSNKNGNPNNGIRDPGALHASEQAILRMFHPQQKQDQQNSRTPTRQSVAAVDSR